MFFKKKRKIDYDLDMTNIPKHIAFIMDGNGRWAKKRKMPRTYGHHEGTKTIRTLALEANRLGVKAMTVYAFSTENWKRSDEEVAGIMDLLRKFLDEHIKKCKNDNFKVNMIGDPSRLDEDIQEKIKTLESLTENNTGLFLHIALNYGGRDELLRATKKIAQKVESGELKSDEIDEDTISLSLDTAGVPDPELLIRTSGELRISNFLLWQLAYTEFIFSDKLWPDFDESDLKEAIFSYQNRDRRFGGRK